MLTHHADISLLVLADGYTTDALRFLRRYYGILRYPHTVRAEGCRHQQAAALMPSQAIGFSGLSGCLSGWSRTKQEKIGVHGISSENRYAQQDGLNSHPWHLCHIYSSQEREAAVFAPYFPRHPPHGCTQGQGCPQVSSVITVPLMMIEGMKGLSAHHLSFAFLHFLGYHAIGVQTKQSLFVVSKQSPFVGSDVKSLEGFGSF